MRVVSLVPSITESLLAWGIRPVACTQYCEQPSLLHVGGTKNPDIEAIVALAVDVVFVDREENRREDAEALERRGVRVVDVAVRMLDDVGPAMERIAATVGLPVEVARACVPSVAASGTGSESGSTPRLRAFVPIWRRPWMTIGPRTYGSTLLTHLGVDNVFGRPDDPSYPEVSLVDAADRGPDVVLAPSEPYAFNERHLDELAEVAPVMRIDGQDLFWWGVRSPAAVERLRVAIAALPSTGGGP